MLNINENDKAGQDRHEGMKDVERHVLDDELVGALRNLGFEASEVVKRLSEIVEDDDQDQSQQKAGIAFELADEFAVGPVAAIPLFVGPLQSARPHGERDRGRHEDRDGVREQVLGGRLQIVRPEIGILVLQVRLREAALGNRPSPRP
jgi:hypothetical protein